MATVRLLGPDLPNPLIVPVSVTDTVGRLKELAVENWPSGEYLAASKLCQLCDSQRLPLACR